MTEEEIRKLKAGYILITKERTFYLSSNSSPNSFLRAIDLISGESYFANPKFIKTLSSQILEKHCT